jgi:hypothetical protein
LFEPRTHFSASVRHVLLDVRRRDCGAAIGHAPEELVRPKRERRARNAAVRPRARGGERRGEAVEVLARVPRAIEVEVVVDAVHQLRFRDLLATFEQIDDRFLARVLQHLEAGNRHRCGVLLDRELRRADRAVGRDVQRLVARVRVRVYRGRIDIHDLFQDDVTAAERTNVAFCLESAHGCVVVRHVVRKLARALLDRGGDDVSDARVGECHDSSPLLD